MTVIVVAVVIKEAVEAVMESETVVATMISAVAAVDPGSSDNERQLSVTMIMTVAVRVTVNSDSDNGSDSNSDR